jgi:predicted AlkP superfamily pyrophosphatase or phosphodiesterase
MARTVVLNVVGLTQRLIGPSTPALASFASQARLAQIVPAFPAVTCTAQTNYLTGRPPASHGIVGNGWYSREDAEVKFWKQSNALVQGPKLWDDANAHDPGITVANLFWWFNMYSLVDFSVTPRPMYPADGRKIPDVYTKPGSLRDELQRELGTFPLFEFWGPRASIRSTKWIAEAARHIETRFSPTLSLVYLPHLDYNLQKVGISHPSVADDLRQVDAVCDDLIRFFESRGVQVVVLSEYGLCDVTTPVHLNRVLRQEGLIAVRDELGHDVLDPGGSVAFAVADHQLAHIYVNDPDALSRVKDIVGGVPGVEMVLDRAAQADFRIDHARAGDLVAVAAPQAWFTYYYWLDDTRAPDYARTVDIHRKPGYDPVELFLDPAIKIPPLTVGWKLAKRKLGFRSLLDVIPLDASLVRGSHGRPGPASEEGPMIMSKAKGLFDGDRIESVDVYGLLKRHMGIGQ